MSFINVQQYLAKEGVLDHLIVLEESSATVDEAAHALGCQPKQIAKTLSFLVGDKPMLIVAAGDTKIDNKKYKNTFHQKAKMIPSNQVEEYIGHAPGGVCPFSVKDDVTIYLDESLKRFDYVYPAAGNGHSAVKMTIEELEKYSGYDQWVDVCKGW